jgi:hypothetical protein
MRERKRDNSKRTYKIALSLGAPPHFALHAKYYEDE